VRAWAGLGWDGMEAKGVWEVWCGSNLNHCPAG
jgi:hypothetical protein